MLTRPFVFAALLFSALMASAEEPAFKDVLYAVADGHQSLIDVDRSDPPLLLMHGDKDLQMSINQAHELQGKYQQPGLTIEFQVMHG